jgi:phenylalanyl-tRNA synthetase beta chain
VRVPLSWLADHVDVRVPVTELARTLTFVGLEIEAVDHVGAEVAGVLTARVLEIEPHPDADRLVLVRVDAGGEEHRVVCGARNFAPGDVVPLAAPGAKLPGGVEVGRRRVRGIDSEGMLASARELGVFDDHAGILVLPPGTEVGADVVEAVGLRDTVLNVKTFPNRGDTMSVRGIAREAALALGAELKPLDLSVPETGPDAAALASVAVEDAEGCPVYVARVVEGVDAAAPAPLWMARRLWLYGQRPLGAVVDVTNYLLIDVGQPLHAFDLDRVPGRRIVVRRAHAGEVVHTLDGRDRAMAPEDTLISSGAEPLALAGIMGGESSEVDPSTTRVLIESAHFPPHAIRRTMRRLGMQTEGAQRWARGVDPAGAAPAADRAAALMAHLAGGTVARGRLVAGPGVPEREVVRLPWRRSAARLGAPADPGFAAPWLEGVGCRVAVRGQVVEAVPPSWRFDLESWADLEEEVARRWGYDKLPSTLPKAAGGRLTHEQRQRRRAREVLAGLGLVEVQTEPFLGPAALDALELAPDDPRRVTLRVANPLSVEAPLLRTTLLPGLAEVARRNLDRGLAGVAVFELGATFLPEPGAKPGPGAAAARPDVPETGHDEPMLLGVLLAGRRPPARFDEPATAYEFADVKGVAEALVRALGVDGVGYGAEEAPPFHPGRCAGVRLGERPLGLVGQLHPGIAARLELPAETFAAELWLTPLLEAVPVMRPAPEASPFPELSFDAAFLVPPGVTAAALEEVLREAGGRLLKRLELFDAYQGPPLPEGYRNLAYRVVLQAPDRTLSDADGAAARDRMESGAGTRLRAELRTAG